MKQAYNFILCLAGLVFGIFLGNQITQELASAFFTFIAASCLLVMSARLARTSIQIAASITLSIAAGILAFTLHMYLFKKNQLQLSGHYLYLVGIVTDKKILAHTRYQEFLTVKLEGGKHEKLFTGQRLDAQIGVYSQCTSNTSLGDKILLKKISIKPTSKTISPDDVSLAKQNIAATIFISNTWQCRILEKEHNSIWFKLWEWREKTYNRLIKKLSPINGAYVGLLFFGNKQHTAITQLQDVFSYWGLSHYLARSGLHIVLLISMWFIFLRFIPIHIKLKNLILCLFLILYLICSWDSTSFLRALFVFLLTQGGLWLERETETLYLLSIICIGMTLHNPLLIFYLDFQLTFGLTFGLLSFSKKLSA